MEEKADVCCPRIVRQLETVLADNSAVAHHIFHNVRFHKEIMGTFWQMAGGCNRMSLSVTDRSYRCINALSCEVKVESWTRCV